MWIERQSRDRIDRLRRLLAVEDAVLTEAEGTCLGEGEGCAWRMVAVSAVADVKMTVDEEHTDSCLYAGDPV